MEKVSPRGRSEEWMDYAIQILRFWEAAAPQGRVFVRLRGIC